MSDKITPKEWRRYVVQQMHSKGFSTNERNVVSAAFNSDLNDAERGESSSFFGSVTPGISENELKTIMDELRNPNSVTNKGAKLNLSDNKLNKLEAILHEALIENK